MKQRGSAGRAFALSLCLSLCFPPQLWAALDAAAAQARAESKKEEAAGSSEELKKTEGVPEEQVKPEEMPASAPLPKEPKFPLDADRQKLHEAFHLASWKLSNLVATNIPALRKLRLDTYF